MHRIALLPKKYCRIKHCWQHPLSKYFFLVRRPFFKILSSPGIFLWMLSFLPSVQASFEIFGHNIRPLSHRRIILNLHCVCSEIQQNGRKIIERCGGLWIQYNSMNNPGLVRQGGRSSSHLCNSHTYLPILQAPLLPLQGLPLLFLLLNSSSSP